LLFSPAMDASDWYAFDPEGETVLIEGLVEDPYSSTSDEDIIVVVPPPFPLLPLPPDIEDDNMAPEVWRVLLIFLLLQYSCDRY
jgi:hypothetical protein